MDKQWLTASELAGLDGLPTSDRRVREKAKKEDWISRKREKGKGLEYHFDALPLATQQALARQAAEAAAATPIAQQARALTELVKPPVQVDKAAQANGMQQLLALPQKQRERAEAKMRIWPASRLFLKPNIASRQLVAGERAFAQAYTEHTLELPEWVYASVKSLSWNSMRRWQKTLDTAGAAALAGRYKPAARLKIDEQPEMADFLKAIITSKPHLVGKHGYLRQLLQVHSDKNDKCWDIPSTAGVRRWVAKWCQDNQAAIAFITDPNRYNSKYRSAVEQAYPWMTMPNDVWEFDSTPVDAMLKEGRHSIIAVIDCYTRRVKLLVSPTSDSEGICLLLRKTLLDWGTLNEGGIAKTDNGSDYVSKRTSGIFNMLSINQERANPYSGWEKPFIERFFRTLSHSIVELLPGYIGHNVADREVIEAAKHFAQRLAEKRKPEAEKEGFELRLTREQLQKFLDDWLDAEYHHKPHSGKGMDGKSPFQKYTESGYRPLAIEDEGALDILLHHNGEATVLKGRVKSGGLEYSAPELMEHTWKGQRVSVFLDPSDVGRAFLYRQGQWDSRVEAHDIRMIGQGISPAAFRERKKEDAKALRKFKREMNDLAKHFGMDNLHQDAIEHFTEQAKGLVAFPQPAREHGNEAIKALSKTAANLRNPAEAQYSEEEKRQLALRQKQLEAKQATRPAGLQLRNEHDKALYLAEESLDRALTEKEQAFMQEYKRQNRFGRKRLDEYIARRMEERSHAELDVMEALRADLENQRLAITQEQGMLARDEHEVARVLSEQALSRPLLAKEEAYLDTYKRTNRLGAKRLEEHMARLAQKRAEAGHKDSQ
jgi:transposase InsO family protein